MISPLGRTIWYLINDDSLDTLIGFGSSYSVYSDILDNTILCQDNFISFSGTFLNYLSAGQHPPFDNHFITYYVWIPDDKAVTKNDTTDVT